MTGTDGALYLTDQVTRTVDTDYEDNVGQRYGLRESYVTESIDKMISLARGGDLDSSGLVDLDETTQDVITTTTRILNYERNGQADSQVSLSVTLDDGLTAGIDELDNALTETKYEFIVNRDYDPTNNFLLNQTSYSVSNISADLITETIATNNTYEATRRITGNEEVIRYDDEGALFAASNSIHDSNL